MAGARIDAPISVNELLFNDALRRAVLFEGLKKSEAARVVDYANKHIFPGVLHKVEMAALAVRDLSPVERLKPWKIQRVKDLDEYLASTVAGQFRSLAKEQRERLAEIGLAEAHFQVDSLRTHVPTGLGVSFATPSVQAVRGIVSGVPVDGKRIGQWYEDLAPAMRDRVNRSLHQGILNGEGTDQLIRRIRGTKARQYRDGVLQVTRHQAAVVTRSTMTHVSAQARELTARENANVVKGVQWVSTLDARTSDFCVALSGQVFEIDKGPRPPAHHQALVPGTRIRTARGEIAIEDVQVGDLVWTHRARWRPVTRVMARRWDAPVIELRLPTGGCLGVTDEHPVLAADGWKPGASLKTGDEVFQYVEQAPRPLPPGSALVPQRVLIDAHDRPSELDEPLVAYEVSASARGVSAAVQLQIDAHLREGDVADPSMDGVDQPMIAPEAAEELGDPPLVVGRFSAVAWRARSGGAFDDARDLDGVPAAHSIGRRAASLSESLGVRAAVVAGDDPIPRFVEELRGAFGLRSDGDAVPAAKAAKRSVREPLSSLDGAQGLASGAVSVFDELDDLGKAEPWLPWHPVLLRCTAVVRATSVAHTGMVYNLEVDEDETYTAEGVVVHNCRSTVSFITKSFRELGIKSDADTSPAARASMNGTVPAKTTYESWLRKQPSEFHDIVLGPARARMWRAGEFRLSQLVTADLRPRTLDELRALKPGAQRFPGVVQPPKKPPKPPSPPSGGSSPSPPPSPPPPPSGGTRSALSSLPDDGLSTSERAARRIQAMPAAHRQWLDSPLQEIAPELPAVRTTPAMRAAANRGMAAIQGVLDTVLAGSQAGLGGASVGSRLLAQATIFGGRTIASEFAKVFTQLLPRAGGLLFDPRLLLRTAIGTGLITHAVASQILSVYGRVIYATARFVVRGGFRGARAAAQAFQHPTRVLEFRWHGTAEQVSKGALHRWYQETSRKVLAKMRDEVAPAIKQAARSQKDFQRIVSEAVPDSFKAHPYQAFVSNGLIVAPLPFSADVGLALRQGFRAWNAFSPLDATRSLSAAMREAYAVRPKILPQQLKDDIARLLPRK